MNQLKTEDFKYENDDFIKDSAQSEQNVSLKYYTRKVFELEKIIVH